MPPLISVVIPLYNKGTIVERSLRSVLCQNYRSFELIVVDDGSTDNSVEVVCNIADDRLILIQQDNGGPSKARNTGVKNARGEWVLFLDADDELLPGALEHFCTLTNLYNNVTLFFCPKYLRRGNKDTLIKIGKKGKVDNPFKDWFYGEFTPGCDNTLFKKELVDKFPYDERLRRFEDGELLIRILPDAVSFIDETPVAIMNLDYSAASSPCNNIMDDYCGHLEFQQNNFWTTMCIYRLYIENRDFYKEEMRSLYPSLRWRYDLLLMFKILNWIKK